MSLANRHPLIHKMRLNLEPNSKKWTLVFFKTKFDNIYLEMEKYFNETNSKSINQKINIEQILIYTLLHPDITPFDYLIKNFSPQIIDINTLPHSNSPKLLIVRQLMDQNKNIILLDDIGLMDLTNSESSLLNLTENIHSNFEFENEIIHDINHLYLNILKEFNFDQLVVSNILIIPFNNDNKWFIDKCFKMAEQLTYNDKSLITNISLTLINFRFGNKIKNVNNLIKNFIPLNKTNMHTLVETFISNKMVVNDHISFDNTDYIYYPYFDFHYSLYLNGSLETKNINVVNSNGFSPAISKKQPFYPLIYKRFADNKSGIFIKKNNNNKNLIPKILHHIWLNYIPVTNYTNAWGRILREPWKYIIWTEEKLKNDVLKEDWLTLYESENSISAKLLVSYLAVLEKYGGIVIDSFIIPIKLFPDDFLSNKFIISFLNENTSGTNLSHRIMASLPGTIDPKLKLPINANAARRPFEGVNNFFINVKLNDKVDSQHMDESNQIFSLFDTLRQILMSTQKDKICIFDEFIISDYRTTIYPSYYFNPNCYFFPKKLLKLAVCVNLWKTNSSEKIIKNGPKRIYKITENSILANLTDDPKDKIMNNI